MARGKRKGSHRPRKGMKPRTNKRHKVEKRDVSHLQQFGESHPVDKEEYPVKRKRVFDSDSRQKRQIEDEEASSEDEPNVMEQLLATLKGSQQSWSKEAVESGSDEEDSDDSTNLPDGRPNEKHASESSSGFQMNDDFIESHTLEQNVNAMDAYEGNSDKQLDEKDETVIQDVEEDDEVEEEEKDAISTDPFVLHFERNLDEEMAESLSSKVGWEQLPLSWPALGQLQVFLPPLQNENHKSKVSKKAAVSLDTEEKMAERGSAPILSKKVDLEGLSVKQQLWEGIEKLTNGQPFTQLQSELFSIITRYQDILYPGRTLLNGEEVQMTYCIHIINHILKTRAKIVHHNSKLTRRGLSLHEFRDQGLVRPKVLILVPFRDSALRIVKMVISLLITDEKGTVSNKKRFLDEYGGPEVAMPKKNPKPEDYEAMFAGNTDDTFRIGLTVTKKSLKLFTPFYSSDIIIASPLGLRMIIGAEGEKERDFDFLTSIEVLVMDQMDVFLMQNWDHVLHIMNHLHLQPKDSHGADFSRVRLWSLSGHASHYRQTILLSSFTSPEINAIFNKFCKNFAGKVKVTNSTVSGSICKVAVQLPQVFHRFDSKSVVQEPEDRFDFFLSKVLPQFRDKLMNHTLIFVSSYFDFVRLRNHFRREDMSFAQICEYTQDGKVAKARDMFFHSHRHFLLYTERFHFFRRVRVKGIRHLIFYQLPLNPHFYSEMANFMQEGYQNRHSGTESNMSVTVVYSRLDALRLEAVVGTKRTAHMLSSERGVHMFVSGEL